MIFGSPAFHIIRILFLGVFTSILAILLTPLLTHFLYKYSIRKQIRSDENAPVYMALHQKKEGTPTMGGILIWGSTIFVTLLFFILSQVTNGFFGALNFLSRAQTWLPLGAMLGAALVGLGDDLLGVLRIGAKGGGLRMREKIIIYTLIALIGAWWFWAKLERDSIFIPFFGVFSLGSWYPLFFVFVLVATTFSMNEADGLDGLAGGISLIGFACLLVVAFSQGMYNLAAFLSVIAGSLVAFLWYNVYPARFFMGDTGAMALGITMGVVAMITDTALFLPFFCFILVAESLSVIIQKIYRKIKKKKLFLSTPIHHHFEAKGWPETKVTMRFWLIAGVVAVFGLALYFLDMFLV